MKAIERNAVDAFFGRRRSFTSGRRGRTSAEPGALYLHGHKIAERRANGRIWVTIAGWDTVTTRRRLRAIGADVYHKRGALYLSGTAWCGDWAPIS